MTRAWNVPARNDLHAALPCGDPCRLRRPRTSRPFARWTGCHLAASAVKGRCALMSARSAFGHPLTAPASRRPGDTGRPGRARTQCPTSRHHPTARKEDAMRGCGCLIAALAGLFLGLCIAGSLLTAAIS
jgi:hypothetical protein